MSLNHVEFPYIPSVVDKSDMAVVKNLLVEMSLTRDRIKILEYGTGYSAIYYPIFMEKEGINYKWHSVEHDKIWSQKIDKLIVDYAVNSKVWLCEVPLRNLRKCGNHSSKIRYARYPELIEGKFDLIYVDGRIRNRCLNVCKNYLKEDGVILLDNADRKFYHQSLKQFNGEFIKPYIWRGTI